MPKENPPSSTKELATISLDKDNLRQYIGFLKERFPGLTQKQISGLANLNRNSIAAILNKPSKGIRRTTAEAIMRVYEKLESGKVNYIPSRLAGKSKLSSGFTLDLDKNNLRQYIDYLQNAFPGLIILDASELAGLSRQRLQTLLDDYGPKVIFKQEVTALFQLYEDLKSGKKTYTPSKSRRKPGKRPTLPRGVPFDRENLRQFINYLKNTFSGLTGKEIARLAGMSPDRLVALLSSYRQKTIRPQEIDAIYKVYYDLKSGKAICELNRPYYDIENFSQYILFLQNSFPGLSLKMIAEMANIKLSRLQYILSKQQNVIIDTQEVENLWNLYNDLLSGKKSYTPSRDTIYRTIGRVDLDKSNLRQYLDFLKETFPVLFLDGISELSGFHPRHLSQLLYNPRCKSISLPEVDALFQVYCDLKNKSKKKPIPFDSNNPSKYIDFLLEKFPGLTIHNIANLAGIRPDTLYRLLNNPEKRMYQKTAKKLFKVYEDLESGRKTYKP